MRPSREPVAVVGMAVMLPGAPDLDTYWHNLRTGYDAITVIPPERRDPVFHAEVADPHAPVPPDRTYCHRGGFLDPFTVDAAGLGIMPNSVDSIEPDQLLTLRVAAAAVADAGGLPGLGDRARIGVILGRGGYGGPRMVRFDHRVRAIRQIVRVLAELSPSLPAAELARVSRALLDPLGPAQPGSEINLVPNLAASRVANRLDLRGPAYTVDAACASSLLAVDQAVGELAGHRCDTVLAGGVYQGHDEAFWAVFSQLRALSPTERIAPLSRDADGLLIGEGAGFVVLRRLADAHRDGDRVYAVIRGVGTASDGRTQSLFNPDASGQVGALRRAWAAAGLDPTAADSVGLVEAHSTGTPVGDAAELTALGEVFGAPPGASAVIGSVKSMIGHTMPAAGIASLIKAALAVHHGVLLPTLHCADPNPLLAATRFRTLDAAKPWEGVGPRRAAVNAFGFGGINAHVVIEQDRPAPPRSPVRVAEPERVLRLAADDPAELSRLLVEQPTDRLIGRYRLGVVDPTERRLSVARRVLARAGQPDWTWGSGGVWFTGVPLLREPGAKTAFVFPGLEADFAPRVDDVAARLGEPPPPSDTGTVPGRAAAAAEVGLLLERALARLGVRPDGLAGHSIGEWTAALVAGMYSGDRPRIGLHDFPLPEVDYLALGCSVDEAARWIAEEPEVVVSHDNAPRQTVVCGPRAAIGRLTARIRSAGVFARPLPFSTGFHTPMMAPYLAPYLTAMAANGARPPTLPMWSATTAARYPDDPAELGALAVAHLLRPVRFRELVEAMHADGYRVFVHMGPGQLGSFVGDTLAGRPHLVLNAASASQPGLTQLRWLATALWVEGADPDLTALDPVVQAPPRSNQSTKDSPGRVGVPVKVSTPVLVVEESARGMLDRRVPLGAGAVPSGLPSGLPAEVAAELSALLAEADAAVRVVAAASVRRPAAPAVIDSPVGLTTPIGSTVDNPVAVRTSVLRVSLVDMPYLAGHRFFRQRADWPDELDRRPVVPATTLVEWAQRAAEAAWPGEVAVAVRDIRFLRWALAEPARPLEIRLERHAAGPVSVQLGECAAMTVELAAEYPPAPDPMSAPGPAVGPVVTPVQVYGDRWMFHGPQFQGLTRVTAHDGDLVSCSIDVLPAPGAVLDNVGQMLACWLRTRTEDRVLAFPVRVDAITFHGPPPPVGARVDCVAAARTPDPTALEMDAEVTHAGRVWARVTGWRDIRLDCDRADQRVYAFPLDHSLSRRLPGEWWRAEDRWTTVASREVFVGVYLSATERAAYAVVPPREQRAWLLGRIAVKDAVRGWLVEHGDERAFPAEILVTGDGDRLSVRGHHGRSLPGLRVTLAPDRGPTAVSARVERTYGHD
ncbi:beta-ketoacyl synthase N-terminal-like domain-containing protein [Actinokineospora sp. NBRC 105648]|uniref:beta-ketoacyl synthase N-terminal-like domain-containing protein n=1 Tax=Actinokineospora sp. NBRC 105648 TaxID=3032206 RepID=UPI0024A2086B|nr:beta-ketoacyl synthase N-terminal-like domain-containing protein [Actinokineospora sp. NBRC 105648]GLZ41820.1 polyketide synthase [Actinokineospora sp. NBRC 105648]